MSVTAINQRLKRENGAIFSMLSERGKHAFYPWSGILAQGAEAKQAKINATIGMASDEQGDILHLPVVQQYLQLEPKEVYPYASSFGLQPLREAWLHDIQRKNSNLGLTSMPVVTQAITHGLSLACTLFLNPGEELIVPTPYWGNYRGVFSLMGEAKLISPPLFADGKLNMASFEEVLFATGEKKVLLLNFPNNPTGYTPSQAEGKQLTDLIRRAGEAGKSLTVLLDDAYFGLFYEKDSLQHSLFTELSQLHERVLAVKLDGATKEYFFWGLRVGFITFGSAGLSEVGLNVLEDKAAGVVRSSISNVSQLSQSLLLKAMNNPKMREQKQWADQLLLQRYEEVKRILSEQQEYEEHFSPLPFNSGYFMCVQLHHHEAETVRQQLLQRGVGLVAQGDLLRVAYSSTPKEQLQEIFRAVYEQCL